MSDTPRMPRSYDEDISREPWCNHDPAAVTNGVCECDETVRQPILRLALPGIPKRCGYCGEGSETWPLGVYAGRVSATCPACFSIVSPVVAVAGDGGHGGCTTIAEHQELQQQVERLIDLVRQLTERITGRSAGHYHDATGYEDTLCQCPSPGTYAPQFRNAHITEENR